MLSKRPNRDGLDVPLVSALDASFSEREQLPLPPDPQRERSSQPAPHPQREVSTDMHGSLAASRNLRDSLGSRGARQTYGNALRPARRSLAKSQPSSPFFIYAHSQWRDALERASRSEDCDPHDAFRIEFVNPTDGSSVMPTMSAFCQLIPKGVTTRTARSTDGSVYTVTEGEGTVTIGEHAFDLSPGDIFVIPSWYFRSFTTTSDLVLFTFSDRAAQQKLGLWREQLS
jgi:gentisate 1,2-dioxygenase